MRVHSDILTKADILTAAIHGNVIVHNLTEHKSRSRKRAFSFYLEGSGVQAGQWGNHATKAATWDEWGIVIARLYTKDPNAHWGAPSYQSAEHFHWCTGNRFLTLTPDEQHKRHKWGIPGTSATGTYHVAQCTKCTAIHRYMAWGHKWSEISG